MARLTLGLAAGLFVGAGLGVGAGKVSAQAATAQSAAITLARFQFDGATQVITQAPTLDFETMARFYRSYAACSSSCIAAATAAPGIETITEPK